MKFTLNAALLFPVTVKDIEVELDPTLEGDEAIEEARDRAEMEAIPAKSDARRGSFCIRLRGGKRSAKWPVHCYRFFRRPITGAHPAYGTS